MSNSNTYYGFLQLGLPISSTSFPGRTSLQSKKFPLDKVAQGEALTKGDLKRRVEF